MTETATTKGETEAERARREAKIASVRTSVLTDLGLTDIPGETAEERLAYSYLFEVGWRGRDNVPNVVNYGRLRGMNFETNPENIGALAYFYESVARMGDREEAAARKSGRPVFYPYLAPTAARKYALIERGKAKAILATMESARAAAEARLARDVAASKAARRAEFERLKALAAEFGEAA